MDRIKQEIENDIITNYRNGDLRLHDRIEEPWITKMKLKCQQDHIQHLKQLEEANKIIKKYKRCWI
jgi:hypothetical protein